MSAPHRARKRPCSQGIDERRLEVVFEEIRPSLAFATAALTQIADAHVVVAAARWPSTESTDVLFPAVAIKIVPLVAVASWPVLASCTPRGSIGSMC